MRSFALATGLMAALAAAAPAASNTPRQDGQSYENIDISDFLVRKYNQENGTVSIDVVDFKLSGDDAADLGCTAQSPAWPVAEKVYTCGESKYRFSLQAGPEDGAEFSLRVYHELGPA
jgi:opacity protein-like surface antigen